jgi:hypothetical protein
MGKGEIKYNYVIAGGSGFYEVAYHDAIILENVRYFNYREKCFRSSRFVKGCLQLAFQEKKNRFLYILFSLILYPWLLRFRFKDDKPLVFIFFNGWELFFQSTYFLYLKKHYPQAKFILYLQDVVAKQHKRFDIKKAQAIFDLIISYDKGDSEKYGAKYYPTPYSTFSINGNNSTLTQSDVYFCGKGKNRLPTIIDLYNRLTKSGLKCDFVLMDVPESKRIQAPGIQYRDEIPYTENLRHVLKTRCILEVMQQDADGFTPRLWESIMYDKHLISNNSLLSSSPYYRPNGMHLLSDLEIPLDWIASAPYYEQSLKDSLSPLRLLQFIENNL